MEIFKDLISLLLGFYWKKGLSPDRTLLLLKQKIDQDPVTTCKSCYNVQVVMLKRDMYHNMILICFGVCLFFYFYGLAAIGLHNNMICITL